MSTRCASATTGPLGGSTEPDIAKSSECAGRKRWYSDALIETTSRIVKMRLPRICGLLLVVNPLGRFGDGILGAGVVG